MKQPCRRRSFALVNDNGASLPLVSKKGKPKKIYMLKNISWSQYLIFVAAVITIYYIVIGLKYFSGDIKDILAGKKKLNLRPALRNETTGDMDTTVSENDIHRFANLHNDEFAAVEELLERMKWAIEDGVHKKYAEEEFKFYLGSLLKEYSSLKYSPLKSSISAFILSECQKYGVTLSENDVSLLWHEVEV